MARYVIIIDDNLHVSYLHQQMVFRPFGFNTLHVATLLHWGKMYEPSLYKSYTLEYDVRSWIIHTLRPARLSSITLSSGWKILDFPVAIIYIKFKREKHGVRVSAKEINKRKQNFSSRRKDKRKIQNLEREKKKKREKIKDRLNPVMKLKEKI